jgi:hypothetical protein
MAAPMIAFLRRLLSAWRKMRADNAADFDGRQF